MDEAFSALDPLIRADMQEELLEIQDRMHKTIVFITHDLDEALKIGDRIAIMKDGMIIQTGTPEQILTEPATEYVKAFVQNVDRTKIITAGSIMRKAPVVNIIKDGPGVAVRKMEQHGSSTIFAIDGDRKLKGIVTIEDAVKLHKKKNKSLDSVIQTDTKTTSPDTPVKQLIGNAIETDHPIAVVDEQNKFQGVVDRASIISEVNLNDPDYNENNQSDETENKEEVLK